MYEYQHELEKATKTLAEISETLQYFLTLYAQRNSQSTEVTDCCRCQCNFCANIETCLAGMEAAPSEIRPASCFGCERGKRHMPIESACCHDFKPGGINHALHMQDPQYSFRT